MATLYIQEYLEVASDSKGSIVQAGKEPAITSQKVTFSSTHGESATFNMNTNFIRIFSDTACYIKFGDTPIAVTATGIPLAANTAEFFAVHKNIKVSAVT
jgi:hypothetical protein